MPPKTLVLLAATLAGCASLTHDTLDARFGPADPTRHDQPLLATAEGVSYRRDVKPILDQRCVVCHGCYDAPCQLKLSSWDGIARGSSKQAVYDAMRLREAPTTRLGEDAQRASQWRQMGFEPVLNERSPVPDHQLAASVLWRSLQLKQAHPLPDTPLLAAADFDFSLNRSNSCPNLAEFDAHAQRHPQAGMPYGLPGLNAHELSVVERWLRAGAPDDAPPPLPAAVAQQVAAWEQFLNGHSPKQQLTSRYLYEHLYLGHLVFAGDAQRQVFRLVRSATPPGQPIARLATRRPFDAPGAPRPYYRLQPDDETLLAKSHLPFELSPQRLQRWRGWFIEADYAVDQLPGYAPELASNPFLTFAALPLGARYRFLLDEAQFFVMNFIKGPVCRGQTALDVINDRFWVYFVDPAVAAGPQGAQMVAREAQALQMPAAEGSTASLLAWPRISASQDQILAIKAEALNRSFAPGHPIDLSYVWPGDGRNPNAALTVFRHFDSASVVQGLVGEPPKTAWVISYPLLERIYYLLVAGYDPYGNIAHQLETRLYMDFLRMEGEANFLMLLPKAARDPLRDHWNRGVGDDVRARINGAKGRFESESGVVYQPSNDPVALQQQLYRQLRGHLGGALSRRFDLALPATGTDAALARGLQQLAAVRGASLGWWPEAVLLRVELPGQAPRLYSLLRNTGHLNVSTLLLENTTVVPAEHTLTVAPGTIGAYPNAIARVTVAELPALAAAMAGLASEDDYRALANRFMLRRTDAGFWATADALQQAYRIEAPAEAGLLDLSRLENR